MCRSTSLGFEGTGEQVEKFVVGSCRQVAHMLCPSLGANDGRPSRPYLVEPSVNPDRKHHVMLVTHRDGGGRGSGCDLGVVDGERQAGEHLDAAQRKAVASPA